jgi:hypothetical protein
MKKLLIFLLLSLGVVSLSFAHSGRTDSSGGHNNYSDGTYHYHNSGSKTSSSGDDLKKFLMLVGFFVFGIPLIDWFFDLFPDSSRKKTKTLVRKHSNNKKNIIEENPDLTKQELIQRDYDLFPEEIELINKAIEQELAIEFLYDGTYSEPIKIEPIELYSGENGLLLKGIWILKLDKGKRDFVLRKISDIKIVD